MHMIGRSLAALIVLVGALWALAADALPAAKLLRDDTGLYPRVVRLAHAGAASGRVLAAVVVPPEGDDPGLSPIYESADGGGTWSKAPIGTVRDPEAVKGLCCIALFELPAQMGQNPAGTLLWAGSVGQNAQNRRMALRVWKSLDRGRSWSYLSSCAKAPNEGGLWEPEFSIAADGALVCHFSDETDPARHSQYLAEVTSTDGGATWSAKRPTVALAERALRPGMPIVRRLPDGRFVMTYEVCALPEASCAAHLRFSRDGLDWGDSADIGRRVFANTGRYFAHTPVLAWAPGGGPQGTLLLSGQLLQEGPGIVPSEGTGRTLMLNTTGGEGNWIEVPAPFALENISDNYCPNYSSPLLPSQGGKRVLELATNFDGPLCKPYYGTGPIAGNYAVDHATRGGGLGQLEYEGAWKADEKTHFSAAPGAAVTLRFAGTGVKVRGSGQAADAVRSAQDGGQAADAVRSAQDGGQAPHGVRSAQDRGAAMVSLDGESPHQLTAAGTELYAQTGLKQGMHRLTLRVPEGGRLALSSFDVDLGR